MQHYSLVSKDQEWDWSDWSLTFKCCPLSQNTFWILTFRPLKTIMCKNTRNLSLCLNPSRSSLMFLSILGMDFRQLLTTYCKSNDTIRLEMKLNTAYEDLYHYFNYADAMECDPLEDTLSQISQGMFFHSITGNFQTKVKSLIFCWSPIVWMNRNFVY